MRIPMAIAATWVVPAMMAACGGAPIETAKDSALPETAPAAEEAAYEAAPVANGGALTGSVRFTGQKPALPAKPVTKNQEICGHEPKPAEEVILGTGGALANVVVALVDVSRGKPVPTGPPVLDQVKCDYVPHVQSVTLGSTLEIRNSDDILHNVHGKLDGKATVFNLAMPLKGQKIPKRLTRPGVIHLQCDAGHTWMQAYIYVVPHPYHATTDTSGSFRIEDIPAGQYKVRAWHERFGTLERDVSVAAGAEASLTFEFQ